MEVFLEQLFTLVLLLIILSVCIFSYRMVVQKLTSGDSPLSLPREEQPLSRRHQESAPDRSPKEDIYEKNEI